MSKGNMNKFIYGATATKSGKYVGKKKKNKRIKRGK